MITFVDILQEAGVPIASGDHRHSRDGWLQIDCPWCGPKSGKFHLGYNQSGQYLNCWRCGKKDLTKTIAALTGKPWQAAKELVRQIPRERGATPRVYDGTLINPPGVQPLLAAHQDYLVGRNFTNWQDLVALWDIQGIGLSPKLGWRIFIPIFHQGQQVSWTTRSIGAEARLRYISADPNHESMSHKKILYGEDYCRHAVIITEGPLDTWAIGPGAVATLGTSYSRGQLAALAKYTVRAICFDAGAEETASRLMSELLLFPGETINIRLESGSDPASADKEEIQDVRDLVFAM